MRRAVVVTAIATAGLGLLWPAAPALAEEADRTVTVSGTAFPEASTHLTWFGCETLFRADERSPLARVVLDGGAPLGRRATSLDLAGTGTASGPVSLVDSVADATHALSVRSAAGASGVAWVWYVTPGTAPGDVWAGRADLVAGAAGWQQIDAAAAAYSWTRVEAATGAVRETAGRATIDDFTQVHGDGPGYLLSGMGCDGDEFALDAVSVGDPGAVTAYDLEGSPVTTTAAASTRRAAGGEEVTLSGTTVGADGEAVGAALVLQARPAGAADFRAVTDDLVAGPDGTVTTRVTPEVSTAYRWFFAERSYADAHTSPVVRVAVGQSERR